MTDTRRKSGDGLPRVFTIGFNKCGTRTIHWYFKSNGYEAVHWDSGNLADSIFKNLINSEPLLSGYEEFEIFSDMENITGDFAFEAYKLYAYLDSGYPGSAFILNTRDIENWIRSRLEHGNGGYARKWKRLLNLETERELIVHWRQDWERHHEKAERYFAQTGSRFLKFNIEVDGPELINQALPEYQLDLEKYVPRGRSSGRAAKPDGIGA
ncbi:MAG TPA: sulfotransferase [Rhizomicrobium sp.]|jgi:hypothetical protein